MFFFNKLVAVIIRERTAFARMTITFLWGHREKPPTPFPSPLYNCPFTTEQVTQITEQTHRGFYSIYLIIEVLLCGGHFLMNKGHEYLHNFHLFGIIYLHVCSPSVFLTIVPLMLPWSPQPFSQMNYSHRLIYNHTYEPFCLSRKLQDDVHC